MQPDAVNRLLDFAIARTGLREYGLVASRYVDDFRRKWIEGHAARDEALVGTADIQSLADLSNSFEVVREMRLVPFGKATVLRLALQPGDCILRRAIATTRETRYHARPSGHDSPPNLHSTGRGGRFSCHSRGPSFTHG
jgi:hypothetical protein